MTLKLIESTGREHVFCSAFREVFDTLLLLGAIEPAPGQGNYVVAHDHSFAVDIDPFLWEDASKV
jgi:DNA-binding FadR family transcriptional regulator